jgi:hypothetical protein
MRPLFGRCIRRTTASFVALAKEGFEQRSDHWRRLCRNVTETQPGLNGASSGAFSVKKRFLIS